MNDKPDVETGGGAYVEGNLAVGGDFVGRDKITTTISGLARRQTYLLVASVLLVTILLLIVGYPYTQKILIRTAPPPDSTGLQAISDSQGLAITALAVNTPWLWLGIRKGEEFFLYKADSTKQAQLTLRPETAVEAPINEMTVDCQGKLWLLLEGVGTQVYDPMTGQLSALLNQQTAPTRLAKSTMYAIATRCLPNQTAEVWLGREGVYTLWNEGTTPVSPAKQLLPLAADQVYSATHTLHEVRALLAVNNTLWVADRPSKQLLALSPDGMTKPQIFSLDDTPLSLGSDRQSGDLWVGADDHLFYISKGELKHSLELASEHGTKSILRASTLAVEGDYLWIGDICIDDSGLPCCPLASYVIGSSAPFCFAPQLMGVYDLIFDEQHSLWIATDNGLFLFSAGQQLRTS